MNFVIDKDSSRIWKKTIELKDGNDISPMVICGNKFVNQTTLIKH